MRARLVPVLGLFAVASVGALAASADAADPTGTARAGAVQQDEGEGDPARGEALFQRGCASCHGAEGEGVDERGPDLRDAGAAAADFYLSTGRMPIDDPSRQTRRKRPAFDEAERADLVAYVASLGDGPPIPELVERGDLAEGQDLYTDLCAACHSSAGAGGAVGQNVYAPGVTGATPLQVAEAVRVGPGAMPAFGERALDDQQLASVIRYVEFLRDPDDRGGAPIGRIGPVPEGLVAWLVGIGALLLAMRWIGDRS